MAKLTIDGVDYDTDEMSDAAKAQLTSVQFCDGEIRRLQAEAAAYQTARLTYASALKKELARKSIDAPKEQGPADQNVEPSTSGDDPEKPAKKGLFAGLFGK